MPRKKLEEFSDTEQGLAGCDLAVLQAADILRVSLTMCPYDDSNNAAWARWTIKTAKLILDDIGTGDKMDSKEGTAKVRPTPRAQGIGNYYWGLPGTHDQGFAVAHAVPPDCLEPVLNTIPDGYTLDRYDIIPGPGRYVVVARRVD